VSANGGTAGSNTGLASPIVVGGVSNGKSYTCTVTATNSNGNGAPSSASAVVIPSTVPTAPAQPTVVAGNAQLGVSFVAPFDGGSGITNFTAACVSSNGGTAGTNSAAGSPIVIGGLSNGKSYTCTVTATNANGTSAPSPASAKAIPSTIPSVLVQPTVGFGNAQVSVSFVVPFDGGSAITSFGAACVSSNGGAAGSASGPGSPVVVGSLTNGKTYTCTVTATNANGTSAPSPASAPVVPSTIPAAPAQPTAGVGNGQLTVSFVAPADGGSMIIRFDASCSSSNGGVAGSNSAVTSPISVGSLSNGKSYSCTVTATNANGTSPPSPASAPVIPSTVPNAPGQPTAGVGNGELTVSFVAPFNGGSPITGYTAACASSNGGAPGSATGAASPIVVAGLSNGDTYTCTVTASNSNGSGAPSVPSPAVVPTRVPDPPAAPAAAPGNARLTVSFVAPFDGGSAIVGYGAACVSSNGGLPGAKAGVSSPIVVTALSNGKSYTCTVTATNANGTSVPSPASAAVVPSTVPTAPAQPKVAVGNAQLTVSFAAPSSGGSPITSYTTTCSSTNGGKPASKAGPRSPLTVTGVTNGRTYKCAVIARNANGAGRGSVASVPVVPFDPATVRARSVHGFRLFAGDGGVFTFGDAANYGSAAGLARDPVVGMASTFDDRGYWLVASDGGIFSFGDARFFGSTGAMRLTQPIVGMTATPTGKGYWLVASDGGIFSFGDARFFGSTGAIRLNQPIVGMAATPTGKGYWLVASDGGIFTFGDARFHGSAAPVARSPIAGMATTATGAGYWIAASDGSVYAFGDAPALGGAPASALRLPVRGIASTSSGRGYWLAAGDGGLFAFGDAPYLPWPAPLVLSDPIRGVSR